MARETTKWPSTRWPITKIMSSDGCNGNRVPLEMGPWYDFREFGCHLGNAGLGGRLARRAGMFAAAFAGFLVVPALAGPLEDAFDAGDFAGAATLWQPLAELGQRRCPG